MFVLDLDLSNIAKAEKDFDNYVEKLERAIDDGLEEIKQSLESKITEQVMLYELEESKLGKTAYVDRGGDSLYIGFNSEYAMYVEYGTGIVGASEPHPHPWAYNVGSKIRPDGSWIYFKDGEFRTTKGQRSKPIIYNTWLYGTRSATSRMRKHIRRIK